MAQIAHLAQLGHLLHVVGERKAVLAKLLLQLRRLLLVKALLRLLDKREHIAHAQNAGGHAFGVEKLDHVQLLARAHKLDGLPCGRPDGEGRAAPGVAVQLGQQNAVDPQRLVKGRGRADRILTGHGVHDQENLIGLHSALDLLQLRHELFVNVETSGGVQKDRIKPVVLGVTHRVLGNLHRVYLPQRKDRNIQLLAYHLQLGDGGGTVHVAGHQQRTLAHLTFQIPGQFRAVGRLARALETHHHNDRGRVGGHVQPLAAAAHECGQLLVDDLDDLLGRCETLQHIRAHSPLRDLRHKVLDHTVAHIRVQKGQADLPHGLLDISLRDAALAPQPPERGVQFFRKALKCHRIDSLSSLFLQPLGGAGDVAQERVNAGVLILAVVDGPKLRHSSLNGGNTALHLGIAPDEPGLVLHLLHGRLGPHDHIPDPLAADAAVLRDLREAQILVVIEIEKLPLPLCQKLPVKIKEHCHAVCLVLHGPCPLV